MIELLQQLSGLDWFTKLVSAVVGGVLVKLAIDYFAAKPKIVWWFESQFVYPGKDQPPIGFTKLCAWNKGRAVAQKITIRVNMLIQNVKCDRASGTLFLHTIARNEKLDVFADNEGSHVTVDSLAPGQRVMLDLVTPSVAFSSSINLVSNDGTALKKLAVFTYIRTIDHVIDALNSRVVWFATAFFVAIQIANIYLDRIVSK